MSTNRDFSLIDANLARAREGIRVIEDIARFIFRDQERFEELKRLRHELLNVQRFFGVATLLDGRAEPDIGKEEVVSGEYERSSAWDIISANMSRSIEAIRVLEEFAKVYIPHVSRSLENIRYRLYALEYRLLIRTPHYYLHRHCEGGVVYCLSDSVDEIISYLDRGARIVQLRDKTSPTHLVYEKAKKICDALAKKELTVTESRPLFFINDHAEITAQLPVDGVHIGQADGGLARARRIVGTAKIIGLSTHSVDQALQGVKDGADYISIGPVYPTDTKPDYQPVGIDTAGQVARSVAIPLFVIGGITPENVSSVYAAGIKNIAAISAAREFLERDS